MTEFQKKKTNSTYLAPPADSCQSIRHFPTVDLMITLTYKLGDYLACLSYIDLALANKPTYKKGREVRQKIFDEYPFLDPDPVRKKRAPTLVRKVEENPELVRLYRERLAAPPAKVVCDNLTFEGLAATLHR